MIIEVLLRMTYRFAGTCSSCIDKGYMGKEWLKLNQAIQTSVCRSGEMPEMTADESVLPHLSPRYE